MSDILSWVENWYAKHCDGEWEHAYGIKIETLDNPGWWVQIDLAGTALENIVIDYNRVEKNETDWYAYSIKDGIYEAAGDPGKLEILLKTFQMLAKKQL